MSLFDKLVDTALRNRADYLTLRPVVEKELLHHDILRNMAGVGLLKGLTFTGDSCLRACYGSVKLSEGLDFTGGADFTKDDLGALAQVLTENLEKRYELPVRVSEPKQTGGRVSTWKLAIETRPGKRDFPAQRIHLDICAIASHDRRPTMLRNLYDVDLGTSGLILQAESREEILADKMVALAFRDGRIKNRDLWDIGWLTQQGIELPTELIPLKLQDHGRKESDFVKQLTRRVGSLQLDDSVRKRFVNEMRRFLPAELARETVENPDYWKWLIGTVGDCSSLVLSVRLD